MAKTVEVLLKRISIKENGQEGVEKAATVVSVSLAYPNVLTPTRSTVKAMKIADNTTIDFLNDINPATERKYGYADRIVFKETVAGRTTLAAGAATVHKTSKLEKFLAAFFGAIFAGAWKLLAGGITNVIVGSVVETAGAAHVKSFEADDEHSNPIGEGFVELEEGTLSSSTIKIDLVAPEDLTVERFQFPVGGGQPQKVKKVLLTKGVNNGFLELEVNVL